MRSTILAALLLAGCVHSPPPADRLDGHAAMLTLDTHLDTPMHFARAGWNFADRHDGTGDIVQVDIPRMADGNLDGGFFAIYTAQGPLTAAGYASALAFARRRSDEIDTTLTRHASWIAPARIAADARRIADKRLLIAFKSMENSYPIGEDLTLLAEFHRRGVRLAGPVHTGNNQFADSSSEPPRWHGLSPLGRRWVAEMNRLGMAIDASHASDAAFDELLALSKTPLILSHSSPRAIFDHPRNLDDARIRRLAAAGGAICVSTIYLSALTAGPERLALLDRLEAIGSLAPPEQAAFSARWLALERNDPIWAADFDKFMAALLHVIRIAGVDHTCIGADWDGGGGIAGLSDITALPKITARLRAAGFTTADIEKIWSGNVLRILDTVEKNSRGQLLNGSGEIIGSSR